MNADNKKIDVVFLRYLSYHKNDFIVIPGEQLEEFDKTINNNKSIQKFKPVIKIIRILSYNKKENTAHLYITMREPGICDYDIGYFSSIGGNNTLSIRLSEWNVREDCFMRFFADKDDTKNHRLQVRMLESMNFGILYQESFMNIANKIALIFFNIVGNRPDLIEK